jgi:hypothetical protein
LFERRTIHNTRNTTGIASHRIFMTLVSPPRASRRAGYSPACSARMS